MSDKVIQEERKHLNKDRVHELALPGCTPTPLASYLKALGLLRLVGEQLDPDMRACWRDDQFTLIGRLDERDLRAFLLKQYIPTPIISPWNGRAGFLEGSDASTSKRKGAVIIRKVLNTAGKRFGPYRKVLESIRSLPTIEELNAARIEVKTFEEKKKQEGLTPEEEARLREARASDKRLKAKLLSDLRACLDEEFLPWLDTCYALSDEAISAPLLGSGGNEGSMDYSVNHLIGLTRLFDPNSDEPSPLACRTIDEALFGEPSLVTQTSNPGFLSPAGTGGPNMGSGFSAPFSENPWNTILMLEGAVLFGSTATRRLDTSAPPMLSFPFVVQTANAGHGGISVGESARPELWIPLWYRPVRVDELSHLFSEGRATIKHRRALSGLDMARAIASLGVDRGIASFQRYGFFERRGQGYYVAAPLERFEVRNNPSVDLIGDLDKDQWLDRFRGLARAQNATNRIQSLVRRLGDALFNLSRERGNPATTIQQVLGLLGEAQLYFSRSLKARDACLPVPWLSEEWFIRAQDHSSELSIAAALAGLHAQRPISESKSEFLMHMRSHVAPECGDWRLKWSTEATHHVTWNDGSLEHNLVVLLQRRLFNAERMELPDKPLHTRRVAPVSDVAAWLANELDATKIAALLLGFSLVRLPTSTRHQVQRYRPLPAAYRFLKPFFCTNEQLRRAKIIEAQGVLHIPPELIRRLVADDVNAALKLAIRQLRIAGVSASFRGLTSVKVSGRRLLASLLVPISDYELVQLLPTRSQTEMTH